MVNLKRTREDILESVLNTVHRKGLTGTGLNELFSLSGASSGSFYNYFRSKQDLGHALIDFEWSKLQLNVLAPAAAASPDPIAQVFYIIDQLEAKQLEQPNCAGCLLGNLIVDLTEQDDSFREHLIQVFQQWEAAIAEKLHQGKPRLRPEVNPDHLAEAILVQMEGAMLMGRLYQTPERIQRGFDQARQLLRSALAKPNYSRD